MRVVEFELKSGGSEETVGFEVRQEVFRGGQWDLTKSENVNSGTLEAKRHVLLEDGERIVIVAMGAEVEMVFDKEQNAAMPRKAFESQPDAGQKAEMEAARQKEVHERTFGKSHRDRDAERAANEARDRVLGEEPKTPHPDSPKQASGSSPQGKPQSPAAVHQSPAPGTITKPGGMTAPGPSTAGQSSKDVK